MSSFDMAAPTSLSKGKSLDGTKKDSSQQSDDSDFKSVEIKQVILCLYVGTLGIVFL